MRVVCAPSSMWVAQDGKTPRDAETEEEGAKDTDVMENSTVSVFTGRGTTARRDSTACNRCESGVAAIWECERVYQEKEGKRAMSASIEVDPAVLRPGSEKIVQDWNDATPARDVIREENGRFAQNAHPFATMVIAPFSDPRPAIRVGTKVRHGFKVVAIRRGVVDVGKRQAATMCAVQVDGAESCDRVRHFKRPKALAKACVEGTLDCSHVRFLREQKRIHNPMKGTLRRYGGFVVSAAAAERSPDEHDTVDPADILQMEEIHSKRSSDTNAPVFIMKQKARAGSKEARDELAFNRDRVVDVAPVETIATRARTHMRLSVPAQARLHEMYEAIKMIREV